MRIIIIKMILHPESLYLLLGDGGKPQKKEIVMSCDAKSQKRFRRFQQKLRRRLNAQETYKTAASVEEGCRQSGVKAGSAR